MEETRFRALIENSWEAIALLTADGVVQYASPSTTRVLGYLPQELVGRCGLDLIHPDDMPRLRTDFAEVLDRPRAALTTESRMQHRDGSWRWTECTGMNLLEDPLVRSIVCNYHDITERKEAEERLQQQATALAAADQRKDEFLAMLAHELRNPLAPIRNAVQLLGLRRADPNQIERAREVIARQVDQLARLVDDLLDVSRITQGKIELRCESVELAAIVHAAVEISSPVIEARQHTLLVRLPPEPVRLQADPTRLEQILTNLLQNAAKYTDPGGRIWLGVAVESASEPVSEAWGPGPIPSDRALITVRDTGIGIPAELLPHVFDLFTQADRSLDRSQGGLGIGLTLVRRLVERHGGRVEARSDGPGKGSEFVVEVPLENLGSQDWEGTHRGKGTEPAGSVACVDRPNSDTRNPKSRRVLVVDDNVDAAGTMAELLELWGHEVRVAHEGPAAVEEAVRFRPEVVLLDIGLPGMNGYEVARQLRQEASLSTTLLIALTGYGQEEDRRQARHSGFAHHLVKPVDLRRLQALLASC